MKRVLLFLGYFRQKNLFETSRRWGIVKISNFALNGKSWLRIWWVEVGSFRLWTVAPCSGYVTVESWLDGVWEPAIGVWKVIIRFQTWHGGPKCSYLAGIVGLWTSQQFPLNTKFFNMKFKLKIERKFGISARKYQSGLFSTNFLNELLAASRLSEPIC